MHLPKLNIDLSLCEIQVQVQVQVDNGDRILTTGNKLET